MTNAPTPGWYQDPEAADRLRYWDGSLWTEHVAAAPAPAPAPVFGAPLPQTRVYPPQATLYSNPYTLPPRASRSVENQLDGPTRVRAALIDTAMVIPFIAIGFGLAPLLSWLSGDSGARHHAYYGAALVLSLVLGIGFVFWNFVIREITVGTDVMRRALPAEATSEEPADSPPSN